MAGHYVAQGVPIDRPAELGRQQAECVSKCRRQVARIRVAQLPCESGEAHARIGQPVERGPHPQLVSVAEEREARPLTEDAAQLEAGDLPATRRSRTWSGARGSARREAASSGRRSPGEPRASPRAASRGSRERPARLRSRLSTATVSASPTRRSSGYGSSRCRTVSRWSRKTEASQGAEVKGKLSIPPARRSMSRRDSST